MEIIHSLLGWVRSPVFSTGMQVGSRLLLVWGILHVAPTTRQHAGFALMVLSWSLTEIPRYLFYAWNLVGKVPFSLTYLRYSTFLVLYPTGISGEIWNIVVALPYIREKKIWSFDLPNRINFSFDYAYFLYFILFTYIYGSWFMYTYMLKQRKKVLGGVEGKEEKKEKTKKQQ